MDDFRNTFRNEYHFRCTICKHYRDVYVIRRYNGNFADFSEIFFKNCEKFSYEAEFAFFWHVVELANKPISIGKFEVIDY